MLVTEIKCDKSLTVYYSLYQLIKIAGQWGQTRTHVVNKFYVKRKKNIDNREKLEQKRVR